MSIFDMSVSFSELYIHDMCTDSYSVCDGLDVYVSPQLILWDPDLQCDGFKRW